MKRRVVITGLGVISPNGIGKEAFWHSIINGVSGIRPYTWGKNFGIKSAVSGQILNFNTDSRKTYGRYAQFALTAARMAVNDANISLKEFNPNRIGVTISSAIADAATMEQNLVTLTDDGKQE